MWVSTWCWVCMWSTGPGFGSVHEVLRAWSLEVAFKENQLAGWIKRSDGEVFLHFASPMPDSLVKIMTPIRRSWQRDNCGLPFQELQSYLGDYLGYGQLEIRSISWDPRLVSSGKEGGEPLWLSFSWIPGQGLLQWVQVGDGPVFQFLPWAGKEICKERRMLCLHLIVLVHEKLALEKSSNKMIFW